MCVGEIDPSSPHSGIQYGDTTYSNPPSLFGTFGTSPGTLGIGTSSPHNRNKGRIKLGQRRRQETQSSVLGEWGEVFSSRRGGGCCS